MTISDDLQTNYIIHRNFVLLMNSILT